MTDDMTTDDMVRETYVAILEIKALVTGIVEKAMPVIEQLDKSPMVKSLGKMFGGAR